VIEPKDATTHVFAQELSGKKVGDGYLASKKEGELSYCIFLSGGVCLSDVYGWIITMNGWQIVDLKTYLQIAQEVWKVLAQMSLKEGDIRQLLHDIIEAKGLVAHSSPARIDRKAEEDSYIHRFTPVFKPTVSQSSSSNKKKNRWATWITGGIDTIGDMFGGCMSWVIFLACIGAVFNKCKGGTSKDNDADSLAGVDSVSVISAVAAYVDSCVYNSVSADSVTPIAIPAKEDRAISKSTKKQSSRSTTPRRTHYHYDDDIDDNSGLDGAY
jgi:hypothetical protein